MNAPAPFYTLLVTSERRGTSTLFAKIDDVFPECGVLIHNADRMDRLQCFVDSCHVGANCMEKLAVRLRAMFDTFPTAQLCYLYFKRRSDGKMRAGLFWRDFRNPRMLGINKWAWERMKTYGQVYQFAPPADFFGIGAPPSQTPRLVVVNS